MAFWVIFPLAVLIVLSGWVMILISAIKRLRSGKQREGNVPSSRPTGNDPSLLQPDWSIPDPVAPDGSSPVVPLA